VISAGQQLRQWREQLGYTIRDVEAASQKLADRHSKEDYFIPLSRLSDIETKGVLPNVFRLYTLSVVYRRPFREVLALYELDLDGATLDMSLAEPPKSHKIAPGQSLGSVEIPTVFDPAFDPKSTTNLGRMIQGWGLVPLSFLAQLAPGNFAYGYIGSEDFTMYPLLVPGSFVQIDEARTKVQEGMWRSEYERPIYFVETRDGFTCCWCSTSGGKLILQPHPLSPEPPRALRRPHEAEIIGQVVAVAMRLGEWTAVGGAPARLAREELS
jgi:transcriptional regulator with XRE-family HTH domain